MPTIQEWVDCVDATGKQLDREKCEKYRALRPELIRWDVSMPSRGLGDTVAKITNAIGIDRIAGKDCGCKKRQAAWNELFPYKEN